MADTLGLGKPSTGKWVNGVWTPFTTDEEAAMRQWNGSIDTAGSFAPWGEMTTPINYVDTKNTEKAPATLTQTLSQTPTPTTPVPTVGNPSDFPGYDYPYPSTNTRNDLWAGTSTLQSGIENYQQNPLSLGTFTAPQRNAQFTPYTPQWQTNSLVYDPAVQSTIMTRFNQSGQGYTPEQLNTLTAAPLNTLNLQEQQTMRNYGENLNAMGLANSGQMAERYGREVAPNYATARENILSSAAAENVRQALAQQQAATDALLNLGGLQSNLDMARNTFDLGKAASNREDFTTALQGDTYDLSRAITESNVNDTKRLAERGDYTTGLNTLQTFLNNMATQSLGEQQLGLSADAIARQLELELAKLGTTENVWGDYINALTGNAGSATRTTTGVPGANGQNLPTDTTGYFNPGAISTTSSQTIQDLLDMVTKNQNTATTKTYAQSDNPLQQQIATLVGSNGLANPQTAWNLFNTPGTTVANVLDTLGAGNIDTTSGLLLDMAGLPTDFFSNPGKYLNDPEILKKLQAMSPQEIAWLEEIIGPISNWVTAGA